MSSPDSLSGVITSSEAFLSALITQLCSGSGNVAGSPNFGPPPTLKLSPKFGVHPWTGKLSLRPNRSWVGGIGRNSHKIYAKLGNRGCAKPVLVQGGPCDSCANTVIASTRFSLKPLTGVTENRFPQNTRGRLGGREASADH